MARRRKIEPVSSEFEGAELGDERLTRRLMRIADAVSASPTSSFPTATGSDGELEGVYRFMSNGRVTPRKILAPHFAASVERAGKGDVLVVHDTTNFVFENSSLAGAEGARFGFRRRPGGSGAGRCAGAGHQGGRVCLSLEQDVDSPRAWYGVPLPSRGGGQRPNCGAEPFVEIGCDPPLGLRP